MKLSSRSFILLTCCFLFSTTNSARGFECPTEHLSRTTTVAKLPVFKALVYADRGDHCEGFLSSFTGETGPNVPYFDIIAFGRSPTNSPGTVTDIVFLNLMGDRLFALQPVNLVVQSFSRGNNYRLDAELKGETFVWPLTDVVQPAISKGLIVFPHLGALAYQDNATSRVFYGIDLLLDPKSTGRAHTSVDFDIIIRPRLPVWNPRFEICQAGEHCCDAISNATNVGPAYRHRPVFRIRSGKPAPGTYCLAIEGDFCPPESVSLTCSHRTRSGKFYLEF